MGQSPTQPLPKPENPGCQSSWMPSRLLHCLLAGLWQKLRHSSVGLIHAPMAMLWSDGRYMFTSYIYGQLLIRSPSQLYTDHFPVLAHIAHDILTISAVSISVEHLFSSRKHTLSDSWSSLLAESALKTVVPRSDWRGVSAKQWITLLMFILTDNMITICLNIDTYWIWYNYIM